jgi:hypothetical protein
MAVFELKLTGRWIAFRVRFRQLEREGRMAVLRSSLRPCEAAEELAATAAAGPAAWGAGDRDLFGEGFSVEELLDLEELCEVNNNVAAELGEAAPSIEEDKSSDSHGSSSVVSYELMPLPPPVMDLPVSGVLKPSFAGKAAFRFFKASVSVLAFGR